MNRFHRDVRRAVERLGASAVEVVSGGKHSTLTYTYAGRRRRATLANTPSDGNALKIKIADIRRDMGLKRRRPMDDVTDTLQYDARTAQEGSCIPPLREMTVRGSVAHRESNRVLEFNFPHELADCLAPNEKFRAERAGQDWMILPGGGSILHRHGLRCQIIVGDRPVARDLPYFPSRDAEYLVSDGQVLVRLLEPVMPIEEVPDFPTADKAQIETKDFVVEEPDLAASLVTRLGANPASDDLRALLAVVRHVEATTPLRLVREGDLILWLARIE